MRSRHSFCLPVRLILAGALLWIGPSRPALAQAGPALAQARPALAQARPALAQARPALAEGRLDLDLSGVRGGGSIRVAAVDGGLEVRWPLGDGASGRMLLGLAEGDALFRALEVIPKGADGSAAAPVAIARDLSPALSLTVGTRVSPEGKPPESFWVTFFDNPVRRPHETFAARWAPRRVKARTLEGRAVVAFDGLSAGPFSGGIEVTVFAGARFFRLDAIVETTRPACAYTFEVGLAGPPGTLGKVHWRSNTEPARLVDAAPAPGERREVAARYRVVAAAREQGALALFPPPHAFQFPRDWSDNLSFAWLGAPAGEPGREGLGVRQPPTGGGNFVPWFNAPPGTRQRIDLFCLLHEGGPAAAVEETLRLTRGDRFARLDGHVTFTSHYHMAIAVARMERRLPPGAEHPIPEFVDVFKDMGVQIIHQGDFHGDGHPKDTGRTRLEELEALFAECRHLSGPDLLVLPGEEINEHLGLAQPGKHPGHWMSFFPRPVYWMQRRPEGTPFVEEIAPYGKVYRVGGREDMVRLLEEERGLAWAAHPRIKASSWTPDIFKDEDFYRSDLWLGAAWKAMPADLSRERLGERVLDLLDDMANWGASADPALSFGARHKQVLGEVDVFKIDRTHELYSHMNINYLRLDALPTFDDGWEPVLDALRRGRFFVTTGEVLIRSFTLGGTEGGDVLRLPEDGKVLLEAEVEGTFPLERAVIITGDGAAVRKEELSLSRGGPFERRRIEHSLDLRGARWARLEVWDAARNGAFSTPVWLFE